MAELGLALISFLAGMASQVGVCARPAMEVITEKQHTTIAIPVEAGIRPPQCS